MDEESLTELINPHKDVDGFILSISAVWFKDGPMVRYLVRSGVMEMLRWAEVDLTGKAVVLGRSFNVGMPQALLSLNEC